MKDLFRLKSTDLEFLSFVTGKLTVTEIDFIFSSVDGITCSNGDALCYFAELYCDNCDCGVEYEITGIQ